jgi:hypothetical protein
MITSSQENCSVNEAGEGIADRGQTSVAVIEACIEGSSSRVLNERAVNQLVQAVVHYGRGSSMQSEARRMIAEVLANEKITVAQLFRSPVNMIFLVQFHECAAFSSLSYVLNSGFLGIDHWYEILVGPKQLFRLPTDQEIASEQFQRKIHRRSCKEYNVSILIKFGALIF